MTNSLIDQRTAAVKTKAKYIAPIEEAELVIRMIEAAGGFNRPAGMTAEQAMALSDQETVGNFRRAAHAAMNYWRECIDNANTSN